MARSTIPRPYQEYLEELHEMEVRGATHEDATRVAFQNLLDKASRPRNLRVVAEKPVRTADGRIVIPDGQLMDPFNVVYGSWEAKRDGTDLHREVERKIRAGYPTDNLLIENTRHALLLQNGEIQGTYALREWEQAQRAVARFVSYRRPEMERFHAAADEFNQRIPQLAAGLEAIIARQKQENPRFRQALEAFLEVCRESVNGATRMQDVEDMLRQHLLTERIFRSVFRNPDFVLRNPVARALQDVVQALIGPHFSSMDLLRDVEPFYEALESAAKTIHSYDEKQQFLHTVYERFFQRVSTRTADTHGIVYTPEPIVKWMVRSVDALLKDRLGASLNDPGVHVLDPCTGTGKFIQEVLRHLDRRVLEDKYRGEIHCNEVLLLPYYVAAQNIEHEYFERVGAYEPFPGICFADTLEMARTQYSMLTPANTQRMQAQEEAQVRVILGNPPYNVGQRNENDDNRNRGYALTDARIRETYGRGSSASCSSRLYDMYVRFFRWASDRLRGGNGVVCLVTNNSFLDQVVFDGMRRALLREFTDVYVLDLGGNVRRNPRLSGTRHNVFGIQVGVAVTLLVRRKGDEGGTGTLHYARVGEYWTRAEKLRYLQDHEDCTKIAWTVLRPDARGNWLTTGLASDYPDFLPMGSKGAKQGEAGAEEPVFSTFTLGVSTNRDAWVYGRSREALLGNVERMVDTFNGDLGRWMAAGRPREVDGLVTRDDTRIKWSSRMKDLLRRGAGGTVQPRSVRSVMYRPFSRQLLYYDPLVIDRPGLFGAVYPTPKAERENVTLCVTDAGAEKPWMVLATRAITDLHLVGAGAGTQCFPLYLYGPGGERTDNVGRAALAEYRARYGPEVRAEDVFHYVYGLLHSPAYRERFGENLKRELPRVPFVSPEHFRGFVDAGRALVGLHADYDGVQPYPLEERFTRNPGSYRVERMKLAADRTEIVVNPSLTLRGVPEEAFRYQLGSRSALEWVLDQQQVRRDARSGIVNDPYDPDRPRAVVDLVEKVIRVSLDTMRIVDGLPPLDIVS